MDNYDMKVRAQVLDAQKIAELNALAKNNPGEKILVTIPNTKGLSSDMLRLLDPSIDIRVMGGYTPDKLQIQKYKQFETKTIYTRNELINIIGEMEKIESGINPNWSDYQKLVYIYNHLKKDIKYDPKYESKDSYDIRTLRGMVSKQTVCAGYAIILKEMLDRQGIKADYVSGYVPEGSAHAWNIVEIDGKKYPIDLTWDAKNYRSGKFGSKDYLGQNTPSFRARHIPGPWEPIQNYETELSSIPKKLIDEIVFLTNAQQDFSSSTYIGTREDGSRFVIAQVANTRKEIEGHIIYRYIYADLDEYGRPQTPITLYSTTNIQEFIQRKEFNRDITEGYEYAINNLLFSVENINNSLKNGTFFIGSANVNLDSRGAAVKSIDEIEKPQVFCDRFSHSGVMTTKYYKRSDGTRFVAQKMLEQPKDVNGVKLMKYDIFEIVPKNGRYVVVRNSVWTEMNLFKDDRQGVADVFLSRERLDRKAQQNSGYIGVYDENGICLSDSNMLTFFDTSKKIDDSQITKRPIKYLPSFDELRNYAVNYTMEYVPDPQNPNRKKLLIKDRITGQIITDKDEKEKIVFANVWLSAAGVKWMTEDQVPGEIYAFNPQARRVYDYICSKLCKDIQKYGVIDTVALFKEIEMLGYKHGQDIVVNLFCNEHQTEYLNDYFNSLYMLDIVPTKPLKPLVNLSNASKLKNEEYGN